MRSQKKNKNVWINIVKKYKISMKKLNISTLFVAEMC